MLVRTPGRLERDSAMIEIITTALTSQSTATQNKAHHRVATYRRRWF
jgi:hypothetical protein